MARVRAPRIPDLYERQPRCRICRDMNRVGYVDSQLARGISAASISRVMTDDMNLPTSSQMILSHQKHYVAPLPATVTNREDLAILVVDRTIKAVKQGKLEPTITHGLQAQAILDRRAEKQVDLDLLATMGKLLSGGMAVAGFVPPPELVVIEGHAEEVT